MLNNIQWHIKSFEELNTQELYNILKLRVDVFVVEQNCPYPELDNDDQKATHIWLENNGEPLAYCRIFPPEIKYKEASIGRVVCHPNFRGKNHGRMLMQKAISTIEKLYNTTAIRISAQDYLLTFYESLGFVSTKKKYVEDGIPHTEMFKF